MDEKNILLCTRFNASLVYTECTVIFFLILDLFDGDQIKCGLG